MVSPQQTMTKHCCFMLFPYPIGPMYTISTKIYHTNQPNAGKYTIHGSYKYCSLDTKMPAFTRLPTATGHRVARCCQYWTQHVWRGGFLKLIPISPEGKKCKKKTRISIFEPSHPFGWPIMNTKKPPHPQSQLLPQSPVMFKISVALFYSSFGRSIIIRSFVVFRAPQKEKCSRLTIVSPIPVPITRQLSCHRR